MDEHVASLRAAFCQGWASDFISTVSAWADRSRLLDTVSSAEAGQWRTSRVPYLREPMDRLSITDPVQRVVLWFGAQLGKTEAGLNWVGYQIECAPGPMMAVQPTTELAQSWSKDRLQHMLSTSPALLDRVGEPKTRDAGNTITAKAYPGGVVYISGANSPVGLRSKPIRYLFLDEIDTYPGDVGNEGDPVSLAEKRSSTFGARRKVLLTSTCTVKGFSRIEREFLASDQRYYYVPCPHCQTMQTLEWSGVKWAKDNPHGAWYECSACGGHIQNSDKTSILAAGEWRATADGDGRTTGYHLSGLYSPVGWVSWGDLADEWIAAQKNPMLLKTFINTRLAQPWDDRAGQGVEPGSLMDRREVFDVELDPEVRVITMGVDVQDDRLECETVAWGPGYESWSLAYTVIPGDPSNLTASGPWADLDQARDTTWMHPTVGPMHISTVCVDTGGHFTGSAYEYVKRHTRSRVFGIKGRSAPAGGQRIPIWPRRPSKNNKGKIDLYIVGIDAAKEDVYARLRLMTPGAGYCHFPVERDADYFAQLTSERLQVTYSKGREARAWVKPDGVRNEALDCRVYAYAGLHAWFSFGRRLDRPLAMPTTVPRPTGTATSSVTPRPIATAQRPAAEPRATGAKRPSSWFRR